MKGINRRPLDDLFYTVQSIIGIGIVDHHPFFSNDSRKILVTREQIKYREEKKEKSVTHKVDVT